MTLTYNEGIWGFEDLWEMYKDDAITVIMNEGDKPKDEDAPAA